MDTSCNICNGLTSVIFVKEQMLGLGETFTYYQCNDCGHTHLKDVTLDMFKYYNPMEYYSFKKGKSFFKSAALKAFLHLGLDKDAVILDYGCGGGQFVKELIAHGYKNAKGYDPYLPFSEAGLTNDITKFSWRWDVITLNHVFEHLENPVEVLKMLAERLRNNGRLILRFPVIDSYAFEKYKENWVQFDAPRHINLFTRKSIKLAIEKAGGYKMLDTYDDSNHFGFTGSELYMKGLSLKSNTFIKRILSFSTYKYSFLAKKLNKKNKGDSIVVILQKK